jgi:nucleoid-associated protein YgaU
MVKNILLHSFFLVLVFCFYSIFSISPALAFSGSGSGTSGSPYQITTCSQLHEISSDLTAHYLLENDVNCNGTTFTPMGDTSSNFFTGTLDGGGHKITNLTINSDENGVAIFEELGSGGVITNIGYDSGSVTGGADTASIGSFAAKSSGGSITKSYSKVNLDGTAAAGIADPTMGGLLGQANSVTISDSYYSGNITNGTVNGNYTAGIAGYLSGGSISNSYSTGSLANGQDVGGLVGRMLSSSTISNSFSTMTFSNDSTVGALVGLLSAGTISSSYWNDTTGGFMTCYFGGNSGCTKVSNNLSYFYTITNAPMSSWDFTNTWSTVNDGTSYPLLYWQSPNPTPTPTATPTPTPTAKPSSNSGSSTSASSPAAATCSAAKPTSAPQLFQITAAGDTATVYFVPVSGSNTKYVVSYGQTTQADSFAVSLDSEDKTGVNSYVINYLYPGTWYFKVRGQNGCMPGDWSGVMHVQVRGGSLAGVVHSSVLGLSSGVPVVMGKCTRYTVQGGDSLWGIASSLLGNGAKFSSIMQENKLRSSVIQAGEILKVGC